MHHLIESMTTWLSSSARGVSLVVSSGNNIVSKYPMRGWYWPTLLYTNKTDGLIVVELTAVVQPVLLIVVVFRNHRTKVL